MREVINALLAMIGATSLTDNEFNSLTIEVFALDVASYNAVLAVLDSRELVSNTRDRLRYYFLARDVQVGELPAPGSSNILVGFAL